MSQQFERAMQELREQQVEDFRLVMMALSQVQSGLESYQNRNVRRMDLLQQLVRDDREAIEARLETIEGRLARLEQPAA